MSGSEDEPRPRSNAPTAIAFPPDLSVPLSDPTSLEGQWKVADAQGSADGAYALGVLLFQRGEVEGARAAWRRADQRGSAEAAYLVAELAGRERLQEADEVLRRPDERGSMLAAFALARLAEQRNDPDVATAAWDRARKRAEVADGRGSADAACILALFLERDGDQAGAEAAWERADLRGSNWGAYGHSWALYQRGEMPGAEAAIERAEQRGLAAAGYSHGVLLSQHGKHVRARWAWRRARWLAAAQGDWSTVAATKRALRPSSGEWLRTHVSLTICILAGLAALGLLWNWRGVAAAVASLVALAVWRRPIEIGSPIETSSDLSPAGDAPEVSFGGASVFGGVGAWPGPTDDRPSTIRTGDVRDRRYWRLFSFLVFLIAGALAAWAAGVYDGNVMLRYSFAWIALVLWWSTAWSAPHALAQHETPLADKAQGDSVRFGISFSPLVFLSFYFRVSVSNPRLIPLIHIIQSRQPLDRPVVRQIRGALPLASVVLVGAFLAALAIVPRQRAVAEAAWNITSTTLEMMAIAGGVALCLYRAARAIARRDEGTLIAAGAYLLTALTGIAIASLLGLLDGWITVWRAFIGVF